MGRPPTGPNGWPDRRGLVSWLRRRSTTRERLLGCKSSLAEPLAIGGCWAVMTASGLLELLKAEKSGS